MAVGLASVRPTDGSAPSVVGRDHPDHRDDVHVPDDHLPVRIEARRAPRVARSTRSPISSCCPTTASSISRWSTTGRMQRGLLRRRRPRDPARGAGDDVPGDDAPAGLSPGLSSAADPGGGGARDRRTWSAISSATTCCISGSRGSSTWPAACCTSSAIQLPETHHRYLLATSFTDYWRRINIYWKDFMVRIFFNPVVFRLKRWPQPAALAAATAVVFLATWLLHAYQLYWLRGGWGFSGARRPVLGHPGRPGRWSTSSSTPRRVKRRSPRTVRDGSLG